MAIDSYVPSDTKYFILQQAFPRDATYKIALYSEDPETDVYTSKNEVRGQGYTSGGKVLEGYKCGMHEGYAYVNFSSPSWQNSTITASCAVIYEVGNGTIVTVLNFDETVSKNGKFEVEFPASGKTSILVL